MKADTVLRWTARAWGGASALLLCAFAFGGREHLRFAPAEAVAFLLFPIGVVVGFAIAWRRELAGGLMTVASFAAFSLYLFAWSGRWPCFFFYLFAAPGLLHVAAALMPPRATRRPLPSVAST